MITARRHQHWIIALLILIFLGQSLAVVAMPCQLMETSSANDHDMTAIDHSMMGMPHDMSQMGSSDTNSDFNQTHDCCKTMSHCSSSSCSLPALAYSLSVNALIENSLVTDSYNNQTPKSPVSSLYRPPIFR